MIALQEISASKRLGKDIWFRFWTQIGPCCTDKPEERALFKDKDDAMRSSAFLHSMSFFEPVEVGDGPGDSDWNKM